VHGVHCVEPDGTACAHYDPVEEHILIIKLGALGDVIRTTPLLHRLKREFPHARITWLTQYPEVVPSLVDRTLPFSLASIVTLRSIHFDIIYNLDKDPEACALTDQLHGHVKRGFILRDGVVAPLDPAGEQKYLTGVFDDVSKANTKSYPQEIFEICGFTFQGERYILDRPDTPGRRWNISAKKKVIGLNTGCGGRWTSRLWPEKSWVTLARTLKRKGYEVILLGGELEHRKNLSLAKKSGARYFGHFPLQEFIGLVDRCDLVVTGVTMATHIAIGLGKKLVLFNNIFNKHEFELYDQGTLIEPERPCTCFYQPTCTNPEYRCMEHLSVQSVVTACEELL